MPTWTDLFVRDSMQDNGTVPSPGYPYTSPDLICTALTTYPNPTQVFTGNYGSDPNVTPTASQNNYIYTRAKNLGSSNQGGTMYVYWAPPSLLMTPSQWLQNALYIVLPGGNQKQYFSAVPTVGANQISVQQTPFILPAIAAGHYCLVGICATSQHPWTQPPTFPTWDDFVMWVRNNQNICWRNLQLVANPNPPEWDSTAALQNPWSSDAPLLIGAFCSGILPNTQITIKCSALGINTTQAANPGQTIFTQGVNCPANFNGYAETIAQTPNGAAWPAGAYITTTAYLGAQGTRPVARFAANFGAHAKHPHVLQALSLTGDLQQGVLVAVGNNTVAYAPTI